MKKVAVFVSAVSALKVGDVEEQKIATQHTLVELDEFQDDDKNEIDELDLSDCGLHISKNGTDQHNVTNCGNISTNGTDQVSSVFDDENESVNVSLAVRNRHHHNNKYKEQIAAAGALLAFVDVLQSGGDLKDFVDNINSVLRGISFGPYNEAGFKVNTF